MNISIPPANHTLFLGDLSCFCQELDIIQSFGKIGEIQDIRLMRSRMDDSCLGYGFITFKDPADAVKAIDEMNGQVVVGRKLIVNWASKKMQQKGNSPKSPQYQFQLPENNTQVTLFGAEIQFSFVSKQTTVLITEATIRGIFEEFGEIQDLCIKKTVFNDFGYQNGYGFIHYPLTPAGISAAIQASFIICQIHIENVLYDCSFTHGFEKFLNQGGLVELGKHMKVKKGGSGSNSHSKASNPSAARRSPQAAPSLPVPPQLSIERFSFDGSSSSASASAVMRLSDCSSSSSAFVMDSGSLSPVN